MGEVTKIPWADSTISWWEGCTKLSPGCEFCYASVRDRRQMIEPVIHWGKGAPRRKSKSAVKQAFSLNRKPWVCDVCGTAYKDQLLCSCESLTSLHRRRIFSLSLGDIFDPEVPIEMLAEALDTIRQCDQVDWLLLSKRPELFFDRMDALLTDLKECPAAFETWVMQWVDGFAPENVWVGTSVEDKQRKSRIDDLRKIPAKVHFLSVEPLLEDLGFINLAGIDWAIVGAESGRNARPCNVQWIINVKDQCTAAGTKVFIKQLGAYCVTDNANAQDWNDDIEIRGEGEGFASGRVLLKDPKGGNIDEFPSELRIREFPNTTNL